MTSAAAKVAFESQATRDFVWPYPKPLQEVTDQPPSPTKDKYYYLPRIRPEECSCYAHGCEADTYQSLVDRETKLLSQVEILKQQMTAVTNQLMDTPCGVTEEDMKTIYQSDFRKRGWPFTEYRRLIAEVDCEKCPLPIPKQVLGLKNGYRDPTSFRLVPHCMPGVDTANPVSFAVTPENISYYFKHWPGRSEYQDTYSRQAAAMIKSSQQYREPFPSTRRRFGDPNC